jgi:RecD/TraA family predicted helicase
MFKVEYAPGMTPEAIERIKQERARREILNKLSDADRALYISKEIIAAAKLAGNPVISATIREITHRKDSGWLRANIDNDGFTAISGMMDKGIILEKGMKFEAAGIVDYWHGRKQLSFAALVISDRGYCEDPFMRAVQRACKSFTSARLQTLLTVFGKDWIILILKDPWLGERDEAQKALKIEYGNKWKQLASAKELAIFHKFPQILDAAPFEKWPIETKQGAVAVARALNDLTPAKVDMLRVNFPVIGNEVINHIDVTQAVDAMQFVRRRQLSFMQADDLNKIGGDNFKPTIPRVIGAMWDALASGEDDGNSALPVTELTERARLQYGYPVQEIASAINQAKTAVYFGVKDKFDQSLVTLGGSDTEGIAFAENYKAEQSIMTNVKRFSADLKGGNGVNYKELDDTQNTAVQMALNKGISIITGGPGTGKTTICNKIGKKVTSVLGLAVAARAARNLTDKTGIESMTIAKYLAMAFGDGAPGPNTIIIDEASMVGSAQMVHILYQASISGTRRIILVGDKDQLPPISWGCPFADLIEANAIPITRLENNYRTGEGSGIALLAREIKNRRPLQPYYNDVVFRNVVEDDIAEKVVAEYAAFIKRGMKADDIGVIAPYTKKQYAYSTDKLNHKIRGILFPGKGLERPYIGDLIIGTKNHTKSKDNNKGEHEFMNGQRGIVIEADARVLAIQFDGNDDIEYFEPSELEINGLPKYVAYGYATTIHKSQGGEYQHVITVVPKNLSVTFGKAGLYTAITRARQTLTIIGAVDQLQSIIERDDPRRCTALKSLLGLPLILKPDLKPDLKPKIKVCAAIDFDAKFKDIAERLASERDPAMALDSAEPIDIG